MRRLWALPSCKGVDTKRYLGRWFTPSDSDNQSGEEYNKAYMEATRVPEAPPVPTEEDAKAKAEEELKRKKRMMALSGGKTVLTSESPALSGQSGKTLLGS